MKTFQLASLMTLTSDKVNGHIFDHICWIIYSSDEILPVQHGVSSRMSMVEQRSSTFLREWPSWATSRDDSKCLWSTSKTEATRTNVSRPWLSGVFLHSWTCCTKSCGPNLRYKAVDYLRNQDETMQCCSFSLEHFNRHLIWAAVVDSLPVNWTKMSSSVWLWSIVQRWCSSKFVHPSRRTDMREWRWSNCTWMKKT